MHFSLLITAWLSFGQLSFDLSAAAAALDRLIDSLKDRNLRSVWKALDQTDAQGQAIAVDPDERIDIHAVTDTGHYYETRFSSGNMWVSSFTRDRSFQLKKEQAGWSLSVLLKPDSEKLRRRAFLQDTYHGLFFLDGYTLSERLQVSKLFTASLPLDRKRQLIWGNSTGDYRTVSSSISFLAIVRFSESGRLAFNERSESLGETSFLVQRLVTTTKARFVSDDFECPGLVLNTTQYSNIQTAEENQNRKTAVTLRSRIDHRSDVDVKDEQLTPAYYGIDEATFQKHVQQADTEARAKARLRPPSPPGPRPVNNYQQYDLLIAIGVPLVLLGVLLIVIRKT